MSINFVTFLGNIVFKYLNSWNNIIRKRYLYNHKNNKKNSKHYSINIKLKILLILLSTIGFIKLIKLQLFVSKKKNEKSIFKIK